MQLETIYETIRNSSSADWHYVPFHSGHGSNYIQETDGSGAAAQWRTQLHRAVYRNDVSLVIDFGLTEEDDVEQSFITENFPSYITDQETKVDWDRIDILWNGVVVDRAHYLSNSSHRFWIPAPDTIQQERSVSETDVRLVELLFVLEVDRTNMDYMSVRDATERAGLAVRPGDPIRSDPR